MADLTGRFVRCQIGGPSSTWLPILGERSTRISTERSPIDCTTRTEVWSTAIGGGVGSRSITVGGVARKGAGWSAIMAAQWAGTAVPLRFLDVDDVVYEGSGLVTKMSQDMAHDGAQIFSVEFVLGASAAVKNGYITSTYTSTWTGSVWGTPVPTGPATCSPTVGAGANTWVAGASTSFGQKVVDGIGTVQSWTGLPAGTYELRYVSGAVTLGGGEWVVSDVPNGCNMRYSINGGAYQNMPDRGRQYSAVAAAAAAVGLVASFSHSGGSLDVHMFDPYLPNNSGSVTFELVQTNVATGTFYRAAGTGDFDCLQGGAAYATVTALPNLLPAPVPSPTPCNDCSTTANTQIGHLLMTVSGSPYENGTFQCTGYTDYGAYCLWFFRRDGGTTPGSNQYDSNYYQLTYLGGSTSWDLRIWGVYISASVPTIGCSSGRISGSGTASDGLHLAFGWIP